MPNLSYRPLPGQIPTDPGVYRFHDRDGRVIYVGKAKNLRQRLSNYFQDYAALHPRTQNMVSTATGVQWTVVNNEVEALTLEYSWIKEYKPRFNVMFRDDKSYPYLAVSVGEEIPRMQVIRGARRAGTRYFGPYSQVGALRKTYDLLLQAFPVRTCSQAVLRRHQLQQRPCLLAHIGKCCAPCVGQTSVAKHRKLAHELCRFMAGNAGGYVRELRNQMNSAAVSLDFEKAARLRDQINALEEVLEQNAVVLSDAIDVDAYALVADELECAVQVFYVRAGRIRGVRAWVVERPADNDESELMASLLQQVYSGATGSAPGKGATVEAASVDDVDHASTESIPPLVITSVRPANNENLQVWLTELRGAKVQLRSPQRGEMRSLMNTVSANAEQALRLHKSRRGADLTQRGEALAQLAEYLGLEHPPLRVECYDISHLQGHEQVASMVVFEDGAPRKSHYRHFLIKQQGADDTAAMSEILTRRFKRLQVELSLPASERYLNVEAKAGAKPRFSYRPDLVVVDGGQAQVNAAHKALAEVGATVPVIGLAKRLEEVWLPQDPYPVILPRTSAALYLLQHLRDESHRFAITHHRHRRSKAMTKSTLDDIPGIGPTRRKALIKHFGSVKALRCATAPQIAEVEGIGEKTAHQIFCYFRTEDQPDVTPAPNTTGTLST